MTRYTTSLQGPIRDKIKTAILFTPQEIGRIMLDIARGLTFLHSHSIIHRDMKSDNIFCILDELNAVKAVAIGDFDQASEITASDKPRTCVGTPGYTAPEVLASGNVSAYTSAVDVWSAGIVLYELLSLKRPYDDMPLLKISSAIMSGLRPTLPRLSDQYKPLIQIYEQCLTFTPEKRPTSSELKELVAKQLW